MAKIVSGSINSAGGAAVNPTSRLMPVNDNDVFEDSNIYNRNIGAGAFDLWTQDDQDLIFGLITRKAVTYRQAHLGDKLVNFLGTFIGIDDFNQKLEMSGNLISNTAGGSAGKHLKVNIGGVDYKIALLNP